MRVRAAVGLLLAAVQAGVALAAPPSVCHGTPADGRLEHGVSLPWSGANFRSYSWVGWMAGRTYVHDRVHATLLDAWAAMRDVSPGVTFVYGETGLQRGGKFEPHRTHRNGLSVDLMVPVTHAGAPATLPTHAFNRYGYDLEFSPKGELGAYRIDFETLAEWLYQIDVAGRRHGAPIARVIFDPSLQKMLWRSERGPELRNRIAFSTRPAWVRHDEHVHVDFDVACRPR